MWSLVLGLIVPIALALLLKSLCDEDAAALVFLPGWIVILRATVGFFASLNFVDLFIGTTALAYAAVLFCAIRLWCQESGVLT